MKKYVQPAIKILSLPEVMQQIYEGSTPEPQLAKPHTDDADTDVDEGWEIGYESIWED